MVYFCGCANSEYVGLPKQTKSVNEFPLCFHYAYVWLGHYPLSYHLLSIPRLLYSLLPFLFSLLDFLSSIKVIFPVSSSIILSPYFPHLFLVSLIYVFRSRLRTLKDTFPVRPSVRKSVRRSVSRSHLRSMLRRSCQSTSPSLPTRSGLRMPVFRHFRHFHETAGPFLAYLPVSATTKVN